MLLRESEASSVYGPAMNEQSEVIRGSAGNLVSCLYDVRSWGASFEIISTLAVAEVCRKIWYPQSDGLEVIILTGEVLPLAARNTRGGEFETGYSDSADYDRQRLHKLVLPLLL